MKIAVDFDGTVAEHAGFPAIGEPMEGVAWALDTLDRLGHTLVLWTCRDGREGLSPVRRWLEKHGLRRYFSAFNSNFMTGSLDPRKIITKVYIDDRNVGGWKGWPEVMRQLRGLL